jgi:crotonobetainyl-CoA:carnitine CoA-transferase CaiB-like acyl-CoA transferase
MDELPDHPLHRERGRFFNLDGPGGSSLQVRTPVTEQTATRPAPTHGQHTAEVLAEYGFSNEEIAQLNGR